MLDAYLENNISGWDGHFAHQLMGWLRTFKAF
jgi:hypothetical protein